MMKLVVFGATGGTGAEVVRQALAGGHEVRVVARRPESVSLPAGPELDRLTVLAGDVLDPASLDGAVTGVDAVLSALGEKPGGSGAVYSKGMATIVDAMRHAGVRRVIGVSAAPAAPPGEKTALNRMVIHPLLERLMGPLYDGMRGMEQLLAESDLDWTVFRPPRLLNRPGTGHVRCAVGRPIPRGWVLPRADLATAMLTAIDDHSLIRCAVTIAT